MSILHGLDSVISVELFGILAGLSLVALSIVAIAWELRKLRKNQIGEGPSSSKASVPEFINQYSGTAYIMIALPIEESPQKGKTSLDRLVELYFGIGYFVSSFTVFILGLFLTLTFDSLGRDYHYSLAFETSNVILTGLSLLLGVTLLFGGVNAIIQDTIKRRFRFSPENWKRSKLILEWILDLILPAQKENQAIKSKTGGTIKTPANKSGDVKRQLADQLKTAFIVGLLSLWLWATTLKSGANVPATKEPWWHFVIASALVLVVWSLWMRKKGLNFRRYWWFPCVVVAVMYLTYWIRGVSVPEEFFRILAIVLFIFASILLLALVLVMIGFGGDGKLGNTIRGVVIRGSYVSWSLSLVALAASVILGWSRLSDAGATGWWMDALILLGLAIIAVVSLVPPWAIDSKGES